MIDLNRFTVEKTLLTVIDMQARLLPAMHDPELVTDRVALLLRGALELHLPVAATEQYPQGLGATIPELATWFPEKPPVRAKTSFSVFGVPEYRETLKEGGYSTLIFCGVEAHVCVLQSVWDALEAGYQVILAGDAVNSRKEYDLQFALESARQAGAWVMSAESILFQLLRNASHPAFKMVSRLVR